MAHSPEKFLKMNNAKTDCHTLVETLDYHADNRPNRLAYRYLENGEDEKGTLTYGELRDRALIVAYELAQHTGQGERAVLLYPAGLDFIVAFLACQYAGVIAVPLYPPIGRRRMALLMSVLEDCRPRLILTVSDLSGKLKSGLPEEAARSIHVLDTDRTVDFGPAGNRNEAHELPKVHAGNIAFLQYTSGSTARPKGVMVSQANIIHNVELIRRGIGGVTRIVSWLPVYHDMGLIGKVLYNLYCGGELTLMSPVDFIKKPVRWLRAMTKYGAEVTAAPNFAYDFCVKQIPEEDLEGLDLSTMMTYCNGAEPIRAETLRSFRERFEPYGFRPEAFMPCYGLAENTLIVSGERATASSLQIEGPIFRDGVVRVLDGGDMGTEVTHSGPVREDTRVVIVDPETKRELPKDRLGEIWVQSPGKAQGYWEKEEMTRVAFKARLLDADGGPRNGQGEFLRTGDLGFLHDGNLFVTGRIKELIIVNGSNYFPTDIELVVEDSHDALASNSCAVIGIDDGQGSERLVVIQEIDRRHHMDFDGPAIADAISRNVFREFQLGVEDVLLLAPMALPRTTSGKIQRVLCRKRYLAGENQGVLYALRPRQ